MSIPRLLVGMFSPKSGIWLNLFHFHKSFALQRVASLSSHEECAYKIRANYSYIGKFNITPLFLTKLVEKGCIILLGNSSKRK